MYGLTRAATTLIGVLVAGFLLWLAGQVLPDGGDPERGVYWASIALVAAGGLTMALSQLLGGWTKWGWPRISGNVFLLGFLPALILGGWVLAAGEPENYWLGRTARNWSGDVGLGGLVDTLGLMITAIAFGIGLVFGFTFDTTGPRVRERDVQEREATPTGPAAVEQKVEDDRRVRIHNGDGDRANEPVAPRSGEPVVKK